MITYIDLFGHPLTQKEINNIDYYHEIYSANDVPYLQKTFKDGSLIETKHFVLNLQQITQSLQQYPNDFFEIRYTQNNFSIKEIHKYQNRILEEKHIIVFDSNGDNIGYKTIKFDNGNLLWSNTEKTYYENGKSKYIFDYKDDGTCLIIYDQDDDQHNISPKDIGNLAITNFTWNGFEYYRFEEPIIPSD